MDDLRFYILFNSISVKSEWWADDNERLCAIEPCLQLKRSPPLVGLKPETTRSVGQRLTNWASSKGWKFVVLIFFLIYVWLYFDYFFLQIISLYIFTALSNFPVTSSITFLVWHEWKLKALDQTFLSSSKELDQSLISACTVCLWCNTIADRRIHFLP